ncbi:acyl-CoA dehydrogenase family protein [Alkalibacterium sp. f15]|uniref:acyl-CoA dehydrogenase family protein n=1 Tax=Alkalibacterium sp. f15 TaxID=3414029 RepID=UPI003BF82376
MAIRSITDISESVFRYAGSELKEKAKEYDQNDCFPRESFDYLADLGVLRIPFTREQGGLGGSLKDVLSIIKTVSTACASTASVLLTQLSFGITPLYMYGTDEQKRKYLPDLLNGQQLGAYAFNEIESGSDISQIETKAIEKEDCWELTGSKHYISNAGEASIYSVVSRMEFINGEKGYGIFLVNPEMKGFSVGVQEEKMGIRGLPVASLSFQNVQVPKENVLGGKALGEDACYAVKNSNKLYVAAQAIGIAEGVFEQAMKYMQKDRQFGKRLIDLPNNQFEMADAYTELFAAKALLDKIEIFDPKDSVLHSMVKLKATSVAVETAKTALHLTGGYGVMRNNSIERYVRDAELTQIYGGGNDTQKSLLARNWL